MMQGAFLYLSPPLQVWFGAGALRHITDELDAVGGTIPEDVADGLAAQMGARAAEPAWAGARPSPI